MSNVKQYPSIDEHGRERTPYAVHCPGADVGVGVTQADGLVYLTNDEYAQQMRAADYRWRCPLCGSDASWDDGNYEQAQP